MLEKEYDFYKKNEKEFLSKYLNKYVIIKDEQLISNFADHEQALNFALEKFEPGTFLLHFVKPHDDIISYSSRVYV